MLSMVCWLAIHIYMLFIIGTYIYANSTKNNTNKIDKTTNYLTFNNIQIKANKTNILQLSLKNYSAEGENKLICESKEVNFVTSTKLLGFNLV